MDSMHMHDVHVIQCISTKRTHRQATQILYANESIQRYMDSSYVLFINLHVPWSDRIIQMYHICRYTCIWKELV